MPEDNDKVFVDNNLNPEKTVDIKSLSPYGSGKSNTHVKLLPSNYKGTLPELKTPCINTRILSVIKTAPVSQNAILPEGYELTGDPIRLVKSDSKEEILPCFVVIKYRLKDMSSNDEFVNVAWYRDGNWNEIEVSKKTIADSRDIVNLSNKGLPVTSTNAKMVVDYLFEHFCPVREEALVDQNH
ncbi:DUF927 domain-containing protein [Desulfolutivibrio sulfoxidireducens]|uniref:DUF927 domain-containing protein n=1 Tax=Desulfolutivibrio sulfoxidireducens TaxID=2773299 RepID=UPI00159DCBF3|nr:DUF927 domain-containing protein [Desulfolutivibrio sulfoxidireducens]QLA16730.1 DUF927 domain-containing protein [Desulfolutivibrio sulfoxidireducens]